MKLDYSFGPRWIEVFNAASPKGDEDRLYSTSLLGQVEQRRRDRGGCRLAADQTRLLEAPQTISQHARSNAGKPCGQLGVATRALDQELPQDEEAPAVADHVERTSNGTGLVVRLHSSSIRQQPSVFQSIHLLFPSDCVNNASHEDEAADPAVAAASV